MVSDDTKTCTRCGRTLPLSDYYRDGRPYTDGYKSECKDCHNALARMYHRRRREQPVRPLPWLKTRRRTDLAKSVYDEWTGFVADGTGLTGVDLRRAVGYHLLMRDLLLLSRPSASKQASA